MRYVDIEYVWWLASKLPSQMIVMSEFVHLLSEPLWGDKSLTPETMLPHFKRMINAELSYPLMIVKEFDNDDWRIVDGMHRLLKAYAFGHSAVCCIVLEPEYSNIVVVGNEK